MGCGASNDVVRINNGLYYNNSPIQEKTTVKEESVFQINIPNYYSEFKKIFDCYGDEFKHLENFSPPREWIDLFNTLQHINYHDKLVINASSAEEFAKILRTITPHLFLGDLESIFNLFLISNKNIYLPMPPLLVQNSWHEILICKCQLTGAFTIYGGDHFKTKESFINLNMAELKNHKIHDINADDLFSSIYIHKANNYSKKYWENLISKIHSYTSQVYYLTDLFERTLDSKLEISYFEILALVSHKTDSANQEFKWNDYDIKLLSHSQLILREFSEGVHVRSNKWYCSKTLTTLEKFYMRNRIIILCPITKLQLELTRINEEDNKISCLVPTYTLSMKVKNYLIENEEHIRNYFTMPGDFEITPSEELYIQGIEYSMKKFISDKSKILHGASSLIELDPPNGGSNLNKQNLC